jgi:hypothetical protein
MIRGRYSAVGTRDVDEHQQTKRADMSRRMRRAQPKSAVRSNRVAIGAGPEQLSPTRVPAEDYASRQEFPRVRRPHLLFSCIFRPAAHRCLASTNRAPVLRTSAAADDYAVEENSSASGIRACCSPVFSGRRPLLAAVVRRRTARRTCARRQRLMTTQPEDNSPASGIRACYFPVFSGHRPLLGAVARRRTVRRSSARRQLPMTIRELTPSGIPAVFSLFLQRAAKPLTPAARRRSGRRS